MAKQMQRSPALQSFIDHFTTQNFGEANSAAVAADKCVRCGSCATTFKDAASRNEFAISGFCQACQDKIFG